MDLASVFPASIYLFKISNSNTKIICETCSKLIIKTPDDVSDVVQLSLLLTLNSKILTELI